MKNLLTLVFLMIFVSASAIFAQYGEIDYTQYPNYKEKYEITINKPFDDVWQSAIKSIEESNCMIITKKAAQGENGLFKGRITTDFCIFAVGDSVWDNFNKYAIKPPFIRGGVWKTGRIQYKIIVTEVENNNINVVVTGEISGHEMNVTNKVHFFQSNGTKETMMLEYIKKNLGLEYKFVE